jgi:hypothetical protein
LWLQSQNWRMHMKKVTEYLDKEMLHCQLHLILCCRK